MAKRKRHLKAYLPAIVGAVFLLGSMAMIVLFIADMEGRPVQRERRIQAITLIKPPPPPPPPPKMERIPEPEPQQIAEQVEAEPEPEPIPDVADEAPPGDLLGLDAEGVAGADGFGLAARRGGRGLLGGGGAGSPFAWYGNIIKNDLLDILGDREELRKKGYAAIVKFWVNPDGSVNRFELARGSNDADIDDLLTSLISEYRKVGEIPPPGMGQPIKLRITSRT